MRKITDEEMYECLNDVTFENDPYPYEGNMYYECEPFKKGCDVKAYRHVYLYDSDSIEIIEVIFWDEEGMIITLTDDQIDMCFEYLTEKFCE